jgi:D-3-phosphoglycerate dehydrogenase / 2-oxoglutarate reductase
VAPRFDVVMTSTFLAEPAVAILEAAGCRIHYMPPYPPAEAVAARVAEVQAHAILTRQGRVTAAAMDASPNLRVIARHGVGVDDVDVAEALRRGILVTRAPGSNAAAVAEHAVAMLAALAKQFHPLGRAIAEGGWRDPQGRVRDLAGMRLGLIGLGDIASRVARMAQAFDIAVSAWSPRLAASDLPGVAVASSLDALLAGADAISLHCPYTEQTRHMIGAAELARMKPGGYVVNTARGGIVDEAALAAALDSGHIAGAALDVFENEPPAADHPLRRHPNAICTPHIGGVTEASLVRMGVMAAECIAWALGGQSVPEQRIVRG